MNPIDSIQVVINTLNLVEVRAEDNLTRLSASIKLLRQIQQEMIEQEKIQKSKEEAAQNDESHDQQGENV